MRIAAVRKERETRSGGRGAQGLRGGGRATIPSSIRSPQAAQGHARLRRNAGSLVRADAHGAEAEARRADPSRHPHRQPHAVRQTEIVTPGGAHACARVSCREVLRGPSRRSLSHGPRSSHELGDLRFRALMTEAGMGLASARDPPALSASASPAARPTVYAGEVLETWMSRAGLVARAGRASDRRPVAAARARVHVAERRHGHRGHGQRRPDLDTPLCAAQAASRRSSIRPSASPVRPASKNMSAAASA